MPQPLASFNNTVHIHEGSGNLSFLCKSDGNSPQTYSIVIVDLVSTRTDAEQSELKWKYLVVHTR